MVMMDDGVVKTFLGSGEGGEEGRRIRRRKGLNEDIWGEWTLNCTYYLLAT